MLSLAGKKLIWINEFVQTTWFFNTYRLPNLEHLELKKFFFVTYIFVFIIVMMVHQLIMLKKISEVFSGVFQGSIIWSIVFIHLLMAIFDLFKMQIQTILWVLTP